MSLHVEHAGATGTAGDGAPPLVLAHGFTQTGRLWGDLAPCLGRHRRLVLVDLPGHAGSSDVRVGLAEGGDLLAAAAGEPCDLLGYSLGARFALHAALQRPELVRRVVLIGGTAGIEDPVARASRRERDDALADELERTGDLEGFLRRWLANPMWATLDPVSAGLAERRRNTAAGLASSLRLAGAGAQEPLWGRLGEVTAPVLAVAGAVDFRFAVAGQRLAERVPAGFFSLVPGASHAAHLEQPGFVAAVVERFLG